VIYGVLLLERELAALDRKLHDALLVSVAFSTALNANATGALIDMHTIGYKTKEK